MAIDINGQTGQLEERGDKELIYTILAITIRETSDASYCTTAA